MGFSLEQFFKQLEFITQHKGWNDEYKIKLLKELLISEKQYAEECNQL